MRNWMLKQCLHVQHGIDLGRSGETLHERGCKHQERRKVLLVTNGGVVEHFIQHCKQANVVQHGFHRGRFCGNVIFTKCIVEFQIVVIVPIVLDGEFAKADEVRDNVTIDVSGIDGVLRQQLGVHEDDLIRHELSHKVMILVELHSGHVHPLHSILGSFSFRFVRRHRLEKFRSIRIEQLPRDMRTLNEITQILPAEHAGRPSAQQPGQSIERLSRIKETIHETQCHHAFGGIFGIVHGMEHVDHFGVKLYGLGEGRGFFVLKEFVGGVEDEVEHEDVHGEDEILRGG
mmetsp:Transcript_43057/g.77406  ORF Transcript_43057/g.77406 Transcript_43057/m.77406 type:complete len:288 (-) Transcript_43057:95-958(-)